MSALPDNRLVVTLVAFLSLLRLCAAVLRERTRLLLEAVLDVMETVWTGEVRYARSFVAGDVDRAQQDTIINAVGIVIIGAVGATIVGAVTGSFEAPQNTGLSSGQDALLEGFGRMLELVKPLLIVLMAVLIVFAVQRLQG